MSALIRLTCLLAFQITIGSYAWCESPDADNSLSIERIYNSEEFVAKSFGGQWLEGEAAYTTLEEDAEGKSVVRHDAATGDTSVMVPASELIPPDEGKPLSIESYQWSKDKNRLLIFTQAKRVWRNNTRGDYWVLDRSSRQLQKLGGDAPASSLMFAKFSPDGKRVAYVRNRNLYMEDLRSNEIRQLTFSTDEDTINGTTDWVYEEELGLRDAFRWSPDGKWIAYWPVSTAGVPKFPLINHTDSLYPKVRWFAYPKVGQ
ncbi:MAG: DPP IV N-terminal domain-containing protein, partial [Rubripirellula sp.]